ncbi:MAG: hypothetical protein R6V17_07090 [Halanaerobacter sp.]
MAHATCTFKKKVKELIEPEEMKVWLTKKHGRRVEYIFKVGSEQFSPPQQVAEKGDYLLFAQGVNEEVEDELQDLFTEFYA